MQFPAVTTLLALAAIANGAVISERATAADGTINTDVNAVVPDSVESHFSGVFSGDDLVAQEDTATTQALQKRVAPVVAVIGIAGAAGAAIIVKMAIEIGADTIKNLGQWNQVRETFTQATTLEMWKRNPNYNKYPAAVCYNKGYGLKDAAKITGKRTAKVSLGLLNTDYDCMYLEGGNAFYTHSEGGYINLSYRYNSRCKFDGKTGDLSCN